MEPLKPMQKRTIAAAAHASAAEVDEYEALLAARFTEDPDFGPTRGMRGTGPDRQRLDELTRKLFPNGIRQS